MTSLRSIFKTLKTLNFNLLDTNKEPTLTMKDFFPQSKHNRNR